jgi:nicotinamide mononucleotide transporter
VNAETAAAADTPAGRLQPIEVVVMTVISVAMLMATWLELWSISWTELLGFLTGGVCVWLVVRESIWNWPIGLANNVVFLVLFWRSRLYADAGLQVVYFALGAYGWWNWLLGGARQNRLEISRTKRWEWMVLLVAVPLATVGLRSVLIAANGAAPLADAVTTVLSLAAQFLLCRKRIEHWWIWIVTDVLYVPLYLNRALPLTAFLYGVFLIMCVIGLRQWSARFSQDRAASTK